MLYISEKKVKRIYNLIENGRIASKHSSSWFCDSIYELSHWCLLHLSFFSKTNLVI